MSLDGSFNLSFELERLVSRCPNLGKSPLFTSLLSKGQEVKEEEVVNALAGVFLHRDYTIPIMGCFRAIAREIVGRVVETLKLVPNLDFSESQGIVNTQGDRFFMDCEEFGDIETVGVIEDYVRHGRFLDLHELACLAFCRVLDLTPYLTRVVDYYYEFGGPPFARILGMSSISELTIEGLRHFREVVWVCHRLLLLHTEYFSSRWNWCCFLDLVHQPGSSSDLGLAVDIRWSAVQILCVLLRLPNKMNAGFGIPDTEVLTCFLRWNEFCGDVSVEKAGWCISRKEALSVTDFSAIDTLKLLKHEGLQKCEWRSAGDHGPFLMTPSIKNSFERAVLAVSQKWPLLLYGPGGAGKTALVYKLAQESGNQVLSIHMDEQIDGRTLIGSYVCAQQPGEFQWQPGPLTQAVQNGFWVLFENIDQAAPDVQAILLPLLEGGSSLLTGYGEAIKVAESFRLFSTITTSKVDIGHHGEGKSALSALWRRVLIRPPTTTDLLDIVTAWYPGLRPIAGDLIETFQQLGGDVNFANRFSLRDLLKWCKRVSGAGFSFSIDGRPEDMRNRIFLEAVDVFAAYAASHGSRLNVMRTIAKMWDLPMPANTLHSLHKPVLQDMPGAVQIGRVTLELNNEACRHEKKPFVEIRSSSYVLERIACAVKWNEPVLLVGETGTGKTTLVQNIATRLGQKLTVLNLSQQSDIADLLGGFRPMDPPYICVPLYKEFENLFKKTFLLKSAGDKQTITDNQIVLDHVMKPLHSKDWKKLLHRLKVGVQRVLDKLRCRPGTKRKRGKERRLVQWENLSEKVEIALRQIASSSGMIFSFVEGAFVTAVRNGQWILLDEVNLAPPETLHRIIGVLDGEKGSLCLAENGVVVDRHPNFRLFACMNPATDAGKRDLPFSLRSRFTEFFVDDVLEDEDLALFVNQFLGDGNTDRDLVNRIVRFYKAAKKESEERLQDGANQKPQYSLRSLYRSLEYVRKARSFGFRRALFDGFCMFFVSLLDERSAELMNEMIISYLLGGDKQIPPPTALDRLLEIKERPGSEQFLRDYVITKSVEEHIWTLARAAFIKRYPVLLQGPTSSGKTSLVQYLAAKTAHEFVRINNHEHTDLQEYLGSYIADATGKLVFHEGVLVKAVRNGHWIVLDELNLAPSDVLEALNRLLDDNRELFVPELGETVRAHPDFMLFATQNPPTFYGGRKMLSRAFRNRFVEIHVDEIPEDELIEILEKKGRIPRSYAKKMISVMRDLQLCRQKSKVFAGKHGFITPRDLFRWANRFRKDGCSYEDLARDGYFLLAERLRDETEKRVVQDVLEKHLRVRLNTDELFKQGSFGINLNSDSSSNIVWTSSMRRLYFLVERCYLLKEPVLLVGETGGGKTTVCQLLSMALGAKLHILNCHQYTETSDFIGGFYPVRERSRMSADFKNLIEQLLLSKTLAYFLEDINLSTDIGKAQSTLNELARVLDCYKKGAVQLADVTEQDLVTFEKMKEELAKLYQTWQTIFVWQDGPLVEAMKSGDLFLVDEISLADDSVLERLNSVLEPDRMLSLAEKGGPHLETVTAHEDFFLLATMNPGGDYGKKELSPALRNRFTEIWVPPVCDIDELREIGQRILNLKLHHIVDPLLGFWEWFKQLQTSRTLTVRDLRSWLEFIRNTESCLTPEFAYLHGAFLVLLDGLSLGTGLSKKEATDLREKCLSCLVQKLKEGKKDEMDQPELLLMENYGWGDVSSSTVSSEHDTMQCDNLFGIHPFFIEKGDSLSENEGFEFLAPTTRRNVLRVLRAMQLPKPVLLEGSPGVGKTSLISAIGKFSGHKVVRINLSEQTDMMDLLGSDLPVESDEGIQFAWSDGILLQALREGSWVLLDEINLAPQSVLEGLNAILDHRAEVFIPELGRSFKCPSSFRVFACQNPTYQGGGRKGLPRSFLNRFTKVYVDELAEGDYQCICGSLFPEIPKSILSQLISFNKRLYEETMLHHKFAQEGSPWEFNLRDVFRSCEIMQGSPGNMSDCFLNVVYVQRMRTAVDRREVLRLYEEVFEKKPFINPYPRVFVDDNYVVIGDTQLKRNHFIPSSTIASELKILPGIRNTLEAAAQCIQQQWLCILIGPTSSGKTSLIRMLASLTGNVLNEINLSSATDISELLGSFEQYNAYRNFRSVVNQVDCYVHEYCSIKLQHSAVEFLGQKNSLITKWLSFSTHMNSGQLSRCDSANGDDWRASLSLLAEIIELLVSELERHMLSVSWSSKDLEKLLLKVIKLQEVQTGGTVPVKFEWAAGVLIKAIENGEWVVLEDANLCNPTVLDRINSLVETHGSITVNECGNIDGKPLVLFPHPNFRMFLTINPSYGDISRAMRNRGSEIFMMHPYWLFDVEQRQKLQLIELEDVKRFLTLSNIPDNGLVNSMAKAHMDARNGGLHLGAQITYLELGRWVQLFQQLLMMGNDVLWSLHKSWEHSYLSALGESGGWDVVHKAKVSYLMNVSTLPVGKKVNVCSENGNTSNALVAFSEESSLCLPGGWPVPLKLLDFVLFSKEACLKQSCMYLEYLGLQRALCERNTPKYQLMKEAAYSVKSNLKYVLDTKLLQAVMYPKHSVTEIDNLQSVTSDFEAVLNKKLFFAADWVIDQAVQKSDLDLYLLWLNWFDSKVRPYCPFFGTLEGLLREELQHPIWQCIFRHHYEVMSQSIVEGHLQSLPLLALESVDLLESGSELCSKHLCNAIKCVGLLRRSLWQWNVENSHVLVEKCLQSVIKSLRKLENVVLNVIIESPSFDYLYQTYTAILEEHISLWNVAVSSQFENLLVHWRALRRNVMKLREVLPEDVENLLGNLDMIPMTVGRKFGWSFSSEKSMLWVHGGHPVLPSAGDIYYKFQQLISFMESVWPRTKNLDKQVEYHVVKIATSSDPSLRSLAVQGLSMASSMLRKFSEVVDIDEKLEEMYEMLSRRFESEKDNLVANTCSKTGGCVLSDSACCIVSPEIICDGHVLDSWLESVTVVDETSLLLDLLVLQDILAYTLYDSDDKKQVLVRLCEGLQNSMNFSVNFSSRPPLDFVPHQEILWILEAQTSIHGVEEKVLSSALEMWFKWHCSLWNRPVVSDKDHLHKTDESVLPDMLVKPVKSSTIQHTLQSSFVIRNYELYCFKLRAVSNNIWQNAVPNQDLYSSLVNTAYLILQLVISSHRKSFSADTHRAIQLWFGSNDASRVKRDDIKSLVSLLASSTHKRFALLVERFIKPILEDLTDSWLLDDSLYHISCAWLRLGALRLDLLLACDELDPAIKYSSKYLKLVEKCKLLALENEVRQYCSYLVGSISATKSDEQRGKSLEKLEFERKRIQKKLVFRSDPGKFLKLKDECTDFYEKTNMNLKVLEASDLVVDLLSVNDWQRTASHFVDYLSQEFKGYLDIIQPIQVAIFEMKLGMALLSTSAQQKEFLSRIQEIKVDPLLDAIFSFMRFPRGYAFEREVQIKFTASEFPFYTIDFAPSIWVEKIGLLKKLITSSERVDGGTKVSPFYSEASLLANILGHIVNCVADTNLLNDKSFTVMDKVFDFFASSWRDVKVQEATRKESEAQFYKFRPRAFELDDVYEVDLAPLGNCFSNDCFREWKDLHSEETIQREPANQLEASEELNLIPECMLNNVIDLYSKLFGSHNLIESPGILRITDADKLRLFVSSYTLGAAMMKDLPGISASLLDSRLVVEHVIRLCTEHEQKLSLSGKAIGPRSFYKDSNPPVVARMVKLLIALRQRVLSLLEERDDHLGLQKILDIGEMLLALPPSTSVAQALSGLQFMVGRIKFLQESGAKISLNDELEPILALVSSFQRMELETWSSALDEVLVQIDINAAKLWLPLYLVLHSGGNADPSVYGQSTLQSLEELIQTSSVGEFRRRLQLILSFCGQLDTGLRLGTYVSCAQKKNRDVLYNVFGIYVQFLPVIMEYIDTSTKSIRRELDEHLKLCQWECRDKVVSMESSKRNRQKLKKLLQKYTDALQQPVMLVLTQQYAQSGLKSQILEQILVKIQENFGDDVPQLCANSFRWYGSWNSEIRNVLESLQQKSGGQAIISLGSKGLDYANDQEPSGFAYQEGWSAVWNNIKGICRTAVETAVIWKDKGKSQLKMRTFSDLLNLLENCGLSRHRSSLLRQLEHSSLFNSKGPFSNVLKSSQSGWWSLMPSYDVQHLLLKHEGKSLLEPDVFGHYISSDNIPLEEIWRSVNIYYFKSLASVRHVQQISLNFHKDFMPDQVNRSICFLEHLLIVQMEQRASAYDFSNCVKQLRACLHCLNNLCSTSASSVGGALTGGMDYSKQLMLIRCMWQQKGILDSLCSILEEELLILSTVAKTHSHTCQGVKAATDQILPLVEKFIPIFKESKASLDQELLGDCGPAIKVVASIPPILISKDVQNQDLITKNFQLVREFEDNLDQLNGWRENKRAVESILLGRFEEIIEKAKEVENKWSKPFKTADNLSGVEAEIGASLDKVFALVISALENLGSSSTRNCTSASLQKISSCNLLFDSYVADLQLDLLSKELDHLLGFAVKLTTAFHLSPNATLELQHLTGLLSLMLDFSDGLLRDHLSAHNGVSLLTHRLAGIFASLFSEGYGVVTEDIVDDSKGERTQEVDGTGMGEGEGKKDVSDQITDEDQLGNSEKREEKDSANELPNKDEKGIEMQDDFDAPTHSLSEDSEDGDDENENDEADQVENAMGDTGEDGEVADEKPWDKEEGENPDGTNEKYESGSSVKDKDPNKRELRAKDDSVAVTDEIAEDNSDMFDENHDQDDENHDEDTNNDAADHNENTEEAANEKEDTAPENPDFDLNDENPPPEQNVDNMDVDTDCMEEDKAEEEDGDMDDRDDDMADGDTEDNTVCPNDGNLETSETNQQDEKLDDNVTEKRDERDPKLGLSAPSRDMAQQANLESVPDPMPNSESTSQSMNEMQNTDSQATALETKWSMNADNQNDLASSENASHAEIMLGNSSEGKLNDDHTKPHMPQHDFSASMRTQPNPLRNIGDALQDWKERVKVSTDLQDLGKETVDDMVDEDAEEYGFTSEFDKGTAQAVGAAMPDQVDCDMSRDETEGDGPTSHDDNKMEAINSEDADAEPTPSHPLFSSRIDEKTLLSKSQDELLVEDSQVAHPEYNSGERRTMENLVNVNKSYMVQDVNQQSNSTACNEGLGEVQNLAEQFDDLKMNAGTLWRKYELQTTRLSQELAEQLRLIMEPTLASKLQGDFKTGKRINMKKVLGFIASYFRKDKIWLRRTKPNKRDYQVVIAVDDSRSMSENCCGDFAVESLVTVCRALSQLEVGKLAVTSFGRQGNIRLLHEFDQPLTSESGVKMISSLTFNQENTLREEPMVDLLKYLNSLLEHAVANARSHSGQNPLEQLVLIIADGRFHDNKEKVKRRVRDLLNRNCMVAFIVLDSAQESVMECKDYIFNNGMLEKVVPYLDSFPFPYYIVLRNIEALPRTLADLLRQWFEMMQSSRD